VLHLPEGGAGFLLLLHVFSFLLIQLLLNNHETGVDEALSEELLLEEGVKMLNPLFSDHRANADPQIRNAERHLKLNTLRRNALLLELLLFLQVDPQTLLESILTVFAVNALVVEGRAVLLKLVDDLADVLLLDLLAADQSQEVGLVWEGDL